VTGSPPLPSVHLLVVHGVGSHDHLSNLLRTYQTLRSNLTSVEAPSIAEDQIPGWRLAQFEESDAPPFLKLEPENKPAPGPGSVGAVFLYEVNYSGLAGVVRRNHPIDLTTLFLGLDLAVCAARQRTATGSWSVLGGDTVRLGNAVQRASSVLAAGTVPIIGIPSIIFRQYIGTFAATFTRFFEDIATYALDKNGERLISAHFDQTMSKILAKMAPADRLVIAAHSLGSVVTHNFLVRQWNAPQRLPDNLITFGSPIGLLMWLWLFLDFTDMDITKPIDTGDQYFCWRPVSNTTGIRRVVSWINVVNCVDPIATSFPAAAVDLSAPAADVGGWLQGGAVAQRFFGRAGVRLVGRSHTEYLNDKGGFIRILLRSAGLDSGGPLEVVGRTAEAHCRESKRVLRRAQWLWWLGAVVFASIYCALVARAFHSWLTLSATALFVWPKPIIGSLAFFQRLIRGGPTKRITIELIRGLNWRDLRSFPYRLREACFRFLRRSKDVEPMQPSPGYVARTWANALSFVPSVLLMALPVAVGFLLTGRRLSPTAMAHIGSFSGLVALAAFMLFVASCAVHELIRTWRQVLRILDLPAPPAAASARPRAAPPTPPSP